MSDVSMNLASVRSAVDTGRKVAQSDGKAGLSQDELRTLKDTLLAQGKTETPLIDRTLNAFDRLDTDGNGSITGNEFLNGFNGILTSGESQASATDKQTNGKGFGANLRQQNFKSMFDPSNSPFKNNPFMSNPNDASALTDGGPLVAIPGESESGGGGE